MAKKKKGSTDLSEGQTIAIAVIVLAIVIVALIYGIQFLVEYFFPNF